jgi:hypothetical protein
VLLHLLEFAVRHNDRDRAARLVAKYRQAASDPGRLGFAELMLRCVQDSISDAGWREAVLRNPANVMAAAQSLALGGLRQPVCAHAAWKAIWFSDTTTGSTRGANRFGALLGLHSLLVARGRYDELRTLMQGDTLLHPKYRGQLYILGALAGGDFEKEADNFADAGLRLFRSGRGNLGNNDLWFLGSWLAHRGRTADAAEMAGVIRATGDEPRHDSLLAASLEARTALASGDSAEALRQLRALTPNATSDLTWAPWEALAGERLLLAQLLMASNQTREAVQVAANFDSPVPISYLMYLPASLSLRIQGAERLGDDRLAQLSRKRLVALGSASQD